MAGGLTQQDIRDDMDFIFSEWEETAARETVTIDGDDYEVLRVGQVAMEQMVEAGLEKNYQFSVYLVAVGAPTITNEETILVFGEEGPLLVQWTRKDPTQVYLRLDLVDEFTT